MGRVVGDMERSRRGTWKLLRTTERPARTLFLSESLPQAAVKMAAPAARRAFVLKPQTGRTHQLRVALKSLGSPVLGDPMYAAMSDASQEERAYLHSAALRIPAGHKHWSEGGAPIEVTCAPTSGEHWCTDTFAAAWQRWFPPRTAEETWFEDTLISSAPRSDVE